MTKIVTYLRNAMTQYDMKIRMKSESAKKSLLPKYISDRRPCRHRTHWAHWAIEDTGFLCSGGAYGAPLSFQV